MGTRLISSRSTADQSLAISAWGLCLIILVRQEWNKKRLTEMGSARGVEVVPRMGFDPMISTLKGWRPNQARRPGHNGILLQSAYPLPGRGP